jgi:hypothetical protein
VKEYTVALDAGIGPEYEPVAPDRLARVFVNPDVLYTLPATVDGIEYAPAVTIILPATNVSPSTSSAGIFGIGPVFPS